MKIVYCIAGTYRSGGMERVLANKANYLVSHGYEVIIVTTDQCGRKPFFTLDSKIQSYDLDINYEENNGKSFLNKVSKYPFKQWRHRHRLSVLLNRIKPDITVSMFCNDVSFINSLNDGSAKVLEIHFSKYKRMQYGRKGLWALTDKLRSKHDESLVRKFNKFVILTHEDAKYWGNIENMKVIYNASPFQNVQTDSRKEKKVIAVGRYTPQKGFDMLLEAWLEVSKACPDWVLEIIGEGNDYERNKMQSFINSNGLTNNIKLIPPTQNITEVYSSASLVAMSSRYEGLPMILIEAQSFGLPIVSFQCKCGPKDIITDNIDGYLIKEGDIKSFAEHIILLLNDDSLRERMGKEAQKSSFRFNEDRIMKQWIELFNTVYENNCRISR